VGLSLRYGLPADIDAVLSLWQVAAENGDRPVDTASSLRALLTRDPECLLVADDSGRLVGTIIAGWDGWRAHLYRLAVAPERRRSGLASLLLDAAERRLHERGATRIDAMVIASNDAGHAFWTARGYAAQDNWNRWVKYY
jgi:ribosomal protein S18 acetylase RimI-like enzyme